MVNFEKKWHELNGKRILVVRPDAAVFDADWVVFFNNELKGYQQDEFFLLLDIRGIEENIGYDGFNRIAALLAKQNIKRSRIGVTTAVPKGYSMLGKLFDKIAESNGIDLHVEIFHDMEFAWAWIESMLDDKH